MRLIIYLTILTFLLNLSVSYAEDNDSHEMWALPVADSINIKAHSNDITFGTSAGLTEYLDIILKDKKVLSMEDGDQQLIWAVAPNEETLKEINSWTTLSTPIRINSFDSDSLIVSMVFSKDNLKQLATDCVKSNKGWDTCLANGNRFAEKKNPYEDIGSHGVSGDWIQHGLRSSSENIRGAMSFDR